MQPSTAISRFDLSLSFNEFSLMANMRRMIGHLVLPPIGVAIQNAAFLKIRASDLAHKPEDTRRAPKGDYNRDTFDWGQDDYATDDHGVEEELDDRTLRIYGSIIRQEQVAAAKAVNRIMFAYENDVAGAVFNPTTWAGLTTAVATAWSNKAGADPIADVDAARFAVHDQCGHFPNALVLTEHAFTDMIRTDRIEDLLKFSGYDDPKNVTPAAMATLLRLDAVLVADAVAQDNQRGITSPDFNPFWDKTMAQVCRLAMPGSAMADDLEDSMPTIGRTIMWQGDNVSIPGAGAGMQTSVIMEEYREERRRGGVLRARNDRVVKIIYPQAGHLLTGLS